MNPARSSNPVFVALDTTDLDYARKLAERVRGSVGGLKLGLEFFSAHGPDGVRTHQQSLDGGGGPDIHSMVPAATCRPGASLA